MAGRGISSYKVVSVVLSVRENSHSTISIIPTPSLLMCSRTHAYPPLVTPDTTLDGQDVHRRCQDITDSLLHKVPSYFLLVPWMDRPFTEEVITSQTYRLTLGLSVYP